jgi:XTP/dITP diphosphohydrolase
MNKIYYITSNPLKFQIAKIALASCDVILEQTNIETPEIQSFDVVEIASFSAKWASRELDKPVALTDAGYFIEALNGFPGPFIKYINKWLTSDDLLRLMKGISNRNVIVKTCLAYCEPNQEPVIFTSSISGSIAENAVKTNKGGTPINEVFIPSGYKMVESQLTKDDVLEFYSKLETYWEKLAIYLSKKSDLLSQ